LNIDNFSFGDLVELAFFMGIGVGLVLAYLMCAIVWRWCMAIKVGELASRLAEKAALDAEIRVSEERLERGKASLVAFFKKIDEAETAPGKAVSQ